jgi:hypothetical protein
MAAPLAYSKTDMGKQLITPHFLPLVCQHAVCRATSANSICSCRDWNDQPDAQPRRQHRCLSVRKHPLSHPYKFPAGPIVAPADEGPFGQRGGNQSNTSGAAGGGSAGRCPQLHATDASHVRAGGAGFVGYADHDRAAAEIPGSTGWDRVES